MKNKGGRPFIDLTGVNVKGWTVVKYLGESFWKVSCDDCREFAQFKAYAISKEKIRTCKCRKPKKIKGVDYAGNQVGVTPELKNRIGVEHGFVTPTEYLGKKTWKVSCLCGEEFVKTTSHLRRYAQSTIPICPKKCPRVCKINLPKPPNPRFHGLTYHKLFQTYENIVRRCTDPSCKNYKYYGAKGVKLHPDWLENPKLFVAYIEEELGPRPSNKYTLDRINTLGNYEPGNLRWATHKEQARNTTRNRLVEFQGQIQPLAAWAEELEIPYSYMSRRLTDGETIDVIKFNYNEFLKQKENKQKELLAFKELSSQTGLSLETLRARYRKGLRGDDLIRTKYSRVS